MKQLKYSFAFKELDGSNWHQQAIVIVSVLQGNNKMVHFNTLYNLESCI